MAKQITSNINLKQKPWKQKPKFPGGWIPLGFVQHTSNKTREDDTRHKADNGVPILIIPKSNYNKWLGSLCWVLAISWSDVTVI